LFATEYSIFITTTTDDSQTEKANASDMKTRSKASAVVDAVTVD